MDIATLVDHFGPWGIVVAILAVLFIFMKDQLEKARQDRNAQDERHDNEIKHLTDVINNNTVALTELTVLIREKGGYDEIHN